MNNDHLARPKKVTKKRKKGAYEVVDFGVTEEVEPENEINSTDVQMVGILTRLLANKDFKAFQKDFLRPRMINVERKLRTSVDVDLIRAQGSAAELEFLLKGLPNELQGLKNTIKH